MRRTIHLWGISLIIWGACITLIGFLTTPDISVSIERPRYTAGFHEVESGRDNQTFRWTTGESTVHLPTATLGTQNVTIALHNGRITDTPLPIEIRSTHNSFTASVPNQHRLYQFLVNTSLTTAPTTVTINAPTFRPAPPGEQGDQRDLGVQVSAVDVEALPGGVPWLIPIALVLLGQLVVLHWLLTSVNISPTLQSLLASLWLPLQLPWLITRPFAQHIVMFSLLVAGLLLIPTLIVVYREQLLAISTRWRTAQDAAQLTARSFPYRWVIFLTTTTVYLSIALFIPYPDGMTSTTGDEPHYLILAHSFYHTRTSIRSITIRTRTISHFMKIQRYFQRRLNTTARLSPITHALGYH